MVGVLVVGSGGGGGGSGRFSGGCGLNARSFRDPRGEEEKEDEDEDEGLEVVGWGCPHHALRANDAVCLCVRQQGAWRDAFVLMCLTLETNVTSTAK